jgi:glycosyltransferase involved in cell wall biosynthesis
VVTIDIEELRALLPDTVGRFYTPGVPRELADALERLASDRQGVRRLRETARSLAESCYTWGHQAAAVEGVLQQAVAGAVSRQP